MTCRNVWVLRLATFSSLCVFALLPSRALLWVYQYPPVYDPPMGEFFDKVNILLAIFAIWMLMALMSIAAGALMKLLVEIDVVNSTLMFMISIAFVSLIVFRLPVMIDTVKVDVRLEYIEIFYVSWAIMFGYILKAPWDQVRDRAYGALRSKLTAFPPPTSE